MILILALLFSAVFGWSACVQKVLSNGSLGQYSATCSSYNSPDYFGCSNGYSGTMYWKHGEEECGMNISCSSSGNGTNVCVYGTPVTDGESMYCRARFSVPVIVCSNQCEVDSLNCVNAGNSWVYDGGATCGGMSCQEPCDTTMNCIEYPFNRCEDVASSGSVYCDENGCSGLPFSRWFSELRTECQNECGEFHTNSITGDTLISFNSSCNDTTQCSDETKCVDFPNSGTYALYKICIVGNEQIGNGVTNKSYPQFVGGGTGNCASLDYPSNNIQDPMNNLHNNVFPNTNNNDVINDNCLVYGIDCPPNYIDTTDYNNDDNRNESHCICERLDGMNHISTIVCPDGSRTTFFGSCDDWRATHSSSSIANSSGSTNPPESSSSGSENPPTSSGGISGEYPDWNIIKRNQGDANSLLGSIAQSLKVLPSNILNGIKETLNTLSNKFTYSEDDEDFIWDRVDSLVTMDTIIDTAGVLNAIFNRLDSNNRIIDTIPSVAYNGCPCITFFSGNNKTSFDGGHIRFKEIKFNMGNFHGFNLCTIIRTIVVAFASVVSFFIGFAIFKNISQ